MDSLDYMPLLGAPNGNLSRRRFFATASSVVASTAIATATIADPGGPSRCSTDTAIADLARQLPDLWKDFQRAVEETGAASQAFARASQDLPSADYERQRSELWDFLVTAAEVLDRAAYEKFCEVEDALLEARPTSIADLKIQAAVASRAGFDDEYEIQPDRAAALVAAVLHLCEGSVS